MLVVLAVACRAKDGFLETPDDPNQPGVYQLRMPSLAGCTYALGDADNYAQPLGLDLTLTYDTLGRLRTATSSVDVSATRSSVLYLWQGDCLARVQTQRTGYLFYDEYECDRQDNPVSWRELSDDGTVNVDWAFANSYDVYDQLIHVEATAQMGPSTGLLSTQDLLWDAQQRLLQTDTIDLFDGTEVKRTYTWDHDRLFGWADRNIGEDKSMSRYFERHRLVTQTLWLEYGNPEQTSLSDITWTYDGDAVWPLSRTFSPTGATFTEQPLTVTCPE